MGTTRSKGSKRGCRLPTTASWTALLGCCREGAAAGPRTLAGYALYYVREDVNGTCLYRRQDFEIGFRVE